MRRAPSASASPSRSPIRLMSTRTRGAANLSFISGMRLCPPASTFASSPCCSRSASASSRVVGAKYSKLGGYTDRSCWLGRRHEHTRRPSGFQAAVAYDADVAFQSVEDVERALATESYLPDRGLA